jgi:hypothetical protein
MPSAKAPSHLISNKPTAVGVHISGSLHFDAGS